MYWNVWVALQVPRTWHVSVAIPLVLTVTEVAEFPPVGVARNSVSDRVMEISSAAESVFADIQPLVSGAKGRLALETGDLDAGLVWAGQVQGLIHDVPTCAALILGIVADAEAIISGRLRAMLG